jgi:predicted component of type VI protein secretion system
MPAQLLALTEGPSVVLDKPILLIGRHAECDIQVESRKVSRRHCVIAQVGDFLVVRDLDSTNGIRINGVRVQEGKLKSGDELTIGNFRYQVTWDEHAIPPRVAAMKKELAQPGRTVDASDDDDELLESCDNPIPLSEVADSSVPAAAKAGRPQNAPAPVSPSPYILPDEIGLAPGSSKVKPAPSESHH